MNSYKTLEIRAVSDLIVSTLKSAVANINCSDI